MNWLDIVIILVLLFSTLGAARQGFSREIIGLVAAFAAVICGIWMYGWAGSFVLPYVSSPRIAYFVGFVLVFVGVLLIGALVSRIVSRFVKTVGMSWFDRLLGAAFGLIRGVLVAVSIVMVVLAFSPGSAEAGPPKVVVESRLAPYIVDTARLFVAAAPKDLKDSFHRHYEQVKGIWEHALQKGLPPSQSY